MRQMMISIFSLFVGSFYLSSLAFAVDLRDATNQQLLDELASRLHGGGNAGGGAVASFLCDNNYYLSISVIGPNGSDFSDRHYLGSKEFCQQQMNYLSAHRTRITMTSIIAICDTSHLNRYSVTPLGEVKTLARQYFSDKEECLRQAQVINSLD